jgi:hypothetical protein
MSTRAAITIRKPRAELERLWKDHGSDFEATFADAPGDRGTEMYVAVEERGRIAEVAGKLTGSDPRQEAMDELRRFKQIVETGVIARSEAVPEGEAAERKITQQAAQAGA